MGPGRTLWTICIVLLLAAPARGALTPYWVNVPITAAAISNDPALANQQTWSLRVTLTEGFWHLAAMRVTLPAGEVFYNNPLGGHTRPPDELVSLFPSVAHDTYVTSPREQTSGTPPSVRSGHPNKFEPPSFGGPTDPLPGVFSVNWIMFGPHGGPGPGDYEIARLTFPVGIFAEVFTTGADPSYTESVQPDLHVLIPQVPESVSASLALTIGWLLVRRR